MKAYCDSDSDSDNDASATDAALILMMMVNGDVGEDEAAALDDCSHYDDLIKLQE